ncbi:MAG: sensor histidine kinase [Pseudomonadota bacterium]
MRSLRTRLLVWLVVPLLFLSAATLYSAFVQTRDTSAAIFDKLLLTLALSISEHALGSGGDVLTDDLLEVIRITTNDNLYYKVVGPDRAFIMGYEDIPEPPDGIRVLESQIDFYDATYLDQSVRVIAVSSLVDRPEYNGWMTTFVAQTLHERRQFVLDTVFEDSVRTAGVVLLTTGLLAVGVTLGLRPLLRLEASVARRSPQDLSPIRTEQLPSEVRGLVISLNDLLLRLSESMSLTKRFVENAAHQLRTPVTALLPQTELALRRAESERERVAVSKIKSSAERISRLTDQLLNLTYAESIRVAKRNFPVVDLSEIAKERVALFRRNHGALPVDMQLDSAPIRGSEVLIGECLDNLLDNARKYGGADNHLSVRSGASEDHSFLEIADRGPGIDPQQYQRVTERFSRLDKTTRGTGLGLAIVKEIVEAHRGELVIGQGSGGIGTRIRCQFPREPSRDAGHSA